MAKNEVVFVCNFVNLSNDRQLKNCLFFVFEEQKRYITQGQTTFVLARNSYPDEIWEKYEMVCERDYQIMDANLTYYLFQRK